MVKVFLVQEKDLEKLRKVVGTEGTVLNPVQDADGRWFISVEEVTSHEFTKFFNQDEISLKTALVEVDYKRPAYTEDPTKFVKPRIKNAQIDTIPK